MRLLWIPLVVAALAGAAIVDRIAVTVGNQVITETEILREISLAAFLNGDKPVYTPEEKRRAADRLVEQKLVRREMEMGNYPGATEEQKKILLEETAKHVGGEQSMRQQLASLGLTEADLEQHLQWQLTLVRFIDLRFRPAIQVTAEEIQAYYQEQVVPKQRPGEPIRLQDVREQILQTLSAAKADALLDEWLKHAKSTTRITYRDEAFR